MRKRRVRGDKVEEAETRSCSALQAIEKVCVLLCSNVTFFFSELWHNVSFKIGVM